MKLIQKLHNWVNKCPSRNLPLIQQQSDLRSAPKIHTSLVYQI